jgi:hypothetical protein
MMQRRMVRARCGKLKKDSAMYVGRQNILAVVRDKGLLIFL